MKRDNFTNNISGGVPFLGYAPKPPLDVDPSPIEGHDLKRWRNREVRWTQRETAKRLPICHSCWCNWEREGVPTPAWRAFLREWAQHGCWEVSEDTLKPGKMRALAAVFGYATIADALDLASSTTRKWGAEGECQDDASASMGAAPLLRWIFDDLGLEPLDRIPKRIRFTQCKLTVREVREIRRRASEPRQSLADEYGVSVPVIRKVVNRRSYQWVGDGDE